MESSSLFSLELVAFFAVVYTLPGWLMALLTRGVRAKLSLDKEGKKEDNSASQARGCALSFFPAAAPADNTCPPRW